MTYENYKMTKVLVGTGITGIGLLLLILGAVADNGNLVNMGSFMFPLGFGFLIGSAH